MDLKTYLKQVEKFLQDYLIESKQDGYVLGVSGGVDSSLVSVLARNAVGKDKLYCVMIPIDSLKADLEDGLYLCNEMGLNYQIIDASEIYHSYINVFESKGISLDTSTKANLKARIRMSILYAIAQKRRSLVVGTDNADETYVGYFTKYGDGGVDLLPIAYLTKGEVVEASKLVGIPTRLAERVPSAGLFEGQTDEKEMGIKYADLDNFVLGKTVSLEAKEKIEHLHKITEHKRNAIPKPAPFLRDEK